MERYSESGNQIKKENFAEEVIHLAVERGLTVRELSLAMDAVKGIAWNSKVDEQSIERTDFPSTHLKDKIEKSLFE